MTRGFYVTIKRGARTSYLLGPFPSVESAGAQVHHGRRLAEEIDPWTHFDAFGVTSVISEAAEPKPLPPGVLNARLGVEL